MNPDNSISLPGFAIGALATAVGTDFIDDALGLANVLGGVAGLMMNIGVPSQSRAAGNPITTVDNPPAPWVDEV